MIYSIHLEIKVLPAFKRLCQCAEEIALTHGDEFAAQWLSGALERDRSLFMHFTKRETPNLTLIKGGSQ